MEKDLQVVGFRIGNETYGVRIASVREIVRVPEITTVPSAPDLIEGVINLRGKIIPVMDLRKRFGSAQDSAVGYRSPRNGFRRRRIRLRHRRRQTEGPPHHPFGYFKAPAASRIQTPRGGRGTRRYRQVILFHFC